MKCNDALGSGEIEEAPTEKKRERNLNESIYYEYTIFVWALERLENR